MWLFKYLEIKYAEDECEMSCAEELRERVNIRLNNLIKRHYSC